mmetsp:Transcript_56589/g.100872  ORF Transcript_56589/g.100872 Transcript_56589/m.100872 type:complete len:218 (+) Transcript_56589:1-654(+)
MAGPLAVCSSWRPGPPGYSEAKQATQFAVTVTVLPGTGAMDHLVQGNTSSLTARYRMPHASQGPSSLLHHCMTVSSITYFLSTAAGAAPDRAAGTATFVGTWLSHLAQGCMGCSVLRARCSMPRAVHGAESLLAHCSIFPTMLNWGRDLLNGGGAPQDADSEYFGDCVPFSWRIPMTPLTEVAPRGTGVMYMGISPASAISTLRSASPLHGPGSSAM